MKFKIGILTLCLSLIIFSAGLSYADDDNMAPSDVQSLFFLKVLSYNRSFKEPVRIGILSGSSKTLIYDAFNSLKGQKKIGHNSFSVQEVTLNNYLSKNINVLYVNPGNKPYLDNIVKVTRNNSILTITGVTDYVEKGPLSVSIGIKDNNKPEIIINLSAVKAEGQDFSSQLLKLARIINKD